MSKFIRALSRKSKDAGPTQKAEKGNGDENLVRGWSINDDDPIVQTKYRNKDLMLFVGDTVRLTSKREGKVTAFGPRPDKIGVFVRVVIDVAMPNSSNKTAKAVWVPMHSIEKVICSGTAATAMNVGKTTKLEPLPDNDVAESVWHGHRKMKRGCCCLVFLLVLNLFAVAYIAKKVEFLSQVFSPNSELRYMPGGTHPFCSDLCVNLCDGNEKSTTIICEISDCMDACSNYFMPSANEDSNDADMALSVSMTNDDSDASNNEYESGHGGSHGGHHPPCGNNGGPGHGGADRS